MAEVLPPQGGFRKDPYSGLVRGLAKFFSLAERPDAAAQRELMRPFAPYRSWATFHLWQTLGDEA